MYLMTFTVCGYNDLLAELVQSIKLKDKSDKPFKKAYRIYLFHEKILKQFNILVKLLFFKFCHEIGKN